MSNAILSSTHPETETFFARHTWKVFLGLSIVVGLFGVGDMLDGGWTFQSGETVTMQRITGMTWEELRAASPEVANLIDLLVRTGGANLVIIGLLSMTVCLTGFRRGERWAWYALWVWPLWMVLIVLQFLNLEKQPASATPVPIISGSFFCVISVLALALPYRKFFPKRHPVHERE
jgi:hypothetical protein